MFFELGGNGLSYSFNYERELDRQLIGRIGFSYLSDDFFIPLTFGKFFGEGKNHFEISSGITYSNQFIGHSYYHRPSTNASAVRTTYLFLTGFIGYRFQKPEGSFLFRAGITPIYEIYDSRDKISGGWFFPLVGISFGHRF